MPIIQPHFVNENYYHIYNRGVAKQIIFHDDRDFHRFLDTLAFYIEKSPIRKFSTTDWEFLKIVRHVEPEKPLVEIISFCLMPNHFHLLMKQIEENGISIFLRRSLNSYTHYYNTKHNRVGPIFQGTFRAVAIETDEQLLHVNRYIHLNPFVSKLSNDPSTYQFSSYQSHLRQIQNRLCNPRPIMDLIGSQNSYRQFVDDYADYARSLAEIRKLLIDFV